MTQLLPRCSGIAVSLMLLFSTATGAQTIKSMTFKTLTDFEHCLQDHYVQDHCLRSLESYVKAHPGEAMSAGKRVRRNFHSHAALPFFEIAQKQGKGDFCADEDVQLAVVSGLSLPADYVNAERARKLFAGPCLREHEAAVFAELKNEKGASYLRENACPILKKQSRTPTACEPTVPPPVVVASEEQLPKLKKADIRLGLVKTYRGPEGESVTLASIEGGDLYLVRFEGIAGPWNGKSILHKRDERGAGKAEFWTEHEGKRWVGIVQRGGMEVYAPGNRPGNGFPISYADKASQAVDAGTVLDAY